MNFRAVALPLIGLSIFFGSLGVIGGPGAAIDERGVRVFHALSDDPAVDRAAIALTWAGSAYVLIPVVIAVAGFLFFRGRRRDAVFLTVTALAERLVVEAIKLLVDRPRPVLEDYPVPVSSFSFPSGHAANSMTSFLALAVVLAPPEHRAKAIAVAIIGSLLVGLTRPVLGVHWPTDIIAGWALGIGWVVLCAWLVRPDRNAA